MNNPNDIVQGKHLDSLAAAFSGAIGNIGGGSSATSGNIILGTTPSTVEGAMWFIPYGSKPILHLRHNGKNYSYPDIMQYKLFNNNDEVISSIPEYEVTYYSNVSEALNKLTGEDNEAFIAAYDEAKEMEGVRVQYFFWFNIPDNLIPEDFAYCRYDFTCPGNGVEVYVNSNPMNVVSIYDVFTEEVDKYYAELTEFGAVMIISAQ